MFNFVTVQQTENMRRRFRVENIAHHFQQEDYITIRATTRRAPTSTIRMSDLSTAVTSMETTTTTGEHGDQVRAVAYNLTHTFVIEKAAMMAKVTSDHQPIFGCVSTTVTPFPCLP